MMERKESYIEGKEEARIMATTTLSEYLELLKEIRSEESTEKFGILNGRKKALPPKSPNKKKRNKNKDCKLMEKAAKELGHEPIGVEVSASSAREAPTDARAD